MSEQSPDTPEERARQAEEFREAIEREEHAPPGPPEQQPDETLAEYVHRRMRERKPEQS